ncbi:Clp protease N-terminal domain-containing protein [Streptomyces sp. NPDC088116]|uniref:Clp protease N-terminal domain-containing protein n=1 Tax=Streptomyces sp. NPDC088116 TaxID=3365825 RepID=UPI00381BDABD
MFERFTQDARDVVTGAIEHSRRTRADEVTDEHMLLALLDQTGTRASFAFAALGVGDRRESLEGALAQARRRGGLSQADAAALAEIGIDVEEIVARVEEAHGTGAMKAGGAGGPGGGDRRPKRWWSGHLPFTPAAKATLTESLRISRGRGTRHIGGEHILLALTARPGVVAEVLADHGVTYTAVERAMFGAAGGSGGDLAQAG